MKRSLLVVTLISVTALAVLAASLMFKVDGDAVVTYSDGSLAKLDVHILRSSDTNKYTISLDGLNGSRQSRFKFQALTLDEFYVEGNEAYMSGIGLVVVGGSAFKTPYMLEVADNKIGLKGDPDECMMVFGYGTSTPVTYDGVVVKGDISISYEN